MRSIIAALLTPAAAAAVVAGQTPPPSPQPGPASRPVPPSLPIYRGFTPGISYRAFVERARALADRDTLRCETSRTTAQVMECGVVMRGPGNAPRCYLSASFVEGNAHTIAFFDSAGFGDKRGVPLVERTQRELTGLFGRPRVAKRGAWEWRYGRRLVRFNWRGRGTARWVSIMLLDLDVLDRIAAYAKPAARRKT
ncbi:MAG TPA: hypothetical protein VM716_05310 [Gemmatimonadales bacterium]|nr:hypothetical protein [Gemmatimonadales bacterium]